MRTLCQPCGFLWHLMVQLTYLPSKTLLALTRIYQVLISPFFTGGACRFSPSCSTYANEAVRRHGAIRGGWLAIWRICRCNPLGSSGLDPVPESPRRHSA